MPLDSSQNLLGGLAQGIKSYFETNRDLDRYNDAQKMKQAGLLREGLIKNADTGDYELTPEAQAKDQAGLIEARNKIAGSDPTSEQSVRARSTAKGILNQVKPGLGNVITDNMTANEIPGMQSYISSLLTGELKQTAGAKKKEQLPPNTLLKVSEGNAIPKILEDTESVLNANKDVFGPWGGRIASFNPYNEKAQALDSNFRAASQAFGKFMEGGVLRKEDEEKYRKMFPQLSDTPEVAKDKLANVRRLLIQRQNSDIDALKGAGYDTESVNKNLIVPEIPDILKGDKKKAGLLESKPKTLKQNGFTYTLNPETGQYE